MTFVSEKKKKKNRAPKPLTPEQRSDKYQLKRMRQRAAILSIEPIDNRNYRVWGGEDTHIVSIVMGIPVCDCRGYRSARYLNCSHVMKYRLVYGDLKK